MIKPTRPEPRLVFSGPWDAVMAPVFMPNQRSPRPLCRGGPKATSDEASPTNKQFHDRDRIIIWNLYRVLKRWKPSLIY